MFVRFIKDAHGYQIGEERDIQPSVARKFIAQGVAREIKPPKTERSETVKATSAERTKPASSKITKGRSDAPNILRSGFGAVEE